ncbi:unnamed protein product [marine sediment metagenome]|uniref:Uncharacterized protein n=1 Tax=marine sediment metagenome TaxID=412755 RepID=X1B0Z6_9ZZZZ
MNCEGYNKLNGCKNNAEHRALLGPLPYRLCNDCYRNFIRDVKLSKRHFTAKGI